MDLLIIPSSIVEAVDNSVDNPVLPVDNFVGIWMFPVQVLQVFHVSRPGVAGFSLANSFCSET